MSTHELNEGVQAHQALAPSVEPSAATVHRAASEESSSGVSCRLGDASCAGAHASSISRRVQDQGSSQRSLLTLQRQYGNQYVGEVLRRAPGAGGSDASVNLDHIERSIEQARNGGSGMDHSTRSRMETAFGADFSDVRVHTGAQADELSGALSARAFTTGRDVFFRQGEYNPGTTDGRELLAHELTHVVQQGGGIRRKMSVSQPGDPHEVEADEMARKVMRMEQEPEDEEHKRHPA